MAATLAELAAETVATSGAPGLGLSVFTASDVVIERGFGARDQEAGLPPTPAMTWLRYASQAADPVAAEPTLAEAKLTLVPGAMGMGPPAGLDLASLVRQDRRAAVRLLRDGRGAVWGAQSGRVTRRLG